MSNMLKDIVNINQQFEIFGKKLEKVKKRNE